MTLYKPESLRDYTGIEDAGKKAFRAVMFFLALAILISWPIAKIIGLTGGRLVGWKLALFSSLVTLVVFNLISKGWPISWLREWKRRNHPGYYLIAVPRKENVFDFRVCTPDSFREWKFSGYRDPNVAFDKGENGYFLMNLSGDWFRYASFRCRLVRDGHVLDDLQIEVITVLGEKFLFTPRELFQFEKLKEPSVGHVVRKVNFLSEHSDRLYDEKSDLEHKFEDALRLLVEIHARLEETKRLKRSTEGAAIRQYLGEQIVPLLPRSSCTFWDQYADLKRRYGKIKEEKKPA